MNATSPCTYTQSYLECILYMDIEAQETKKKKPIICSKDYRIKEDVRLFYTFKNKM